MKAAEKAKLITKNIVTKVGLLSALIHIHFIISSIFPNSYLTSERYKDTSEVMLFVIVMAIFVSSAASIIAIVDSKE